MPCPTTTSSGKKFVLELAWYDVGVMRYDAFRGKKRTSRKNMCAAKHSVPAINISRAHCFVEAEFLCGDKKRFTM